MATAEQRALHKRPAVGRPLYVKTSILVLCGPKSCYPNARAHISEGWRLFVEDACVWLGYDGHWARVPWDSVQFVAYERVEPDPET